MSGKEMSLQQIKCVIVGDGDVGKTCMLQCYAEDKFPEEHVPKLIDSFSTFVKIDGVPIALSLWDTAGHEDFDRLRPLVYPFTNLHYGLLKEDGNTYFAPDPDCVSVDFGVTCLGLNDICLSDESFFPNLPGYISGTCLMIKEDVFLICFSVTRRASYNNVKHKWEPEIRHHCPDVPVLLVGMKIDLRDSKEKYNPTDTISSAEGVALKHKIKAVKYVECSAKTHNGIKNVIDEAVRAVLVPKKLRHSDRCILI